MWSWTYGYTYGKSKSYVIELKEFNMLSYNKLYWYIHSLYRGDSDFKENPDPEGPGTNIKRANIITSE
jgi:hypothetical protein